MIVAELVTNCLKYAFPGGRSGAVRIRLIKLEEKYRLEVADDGIGIDVSAAGKRQSFGLRLVSLLTKQLRASVEQDGTHGTRVAVNFPVQPLQAGEKS